MSMSMSIPSSPSDCESSVTDRSVASSRFDSFCEIDTKTKIKKDMSQCGLDKVSFIVQLFVLSARAKVLSAQEFICNHQDGWQFDKTILYKLRLRLAGTEVRLKKKERKS